jgi:hypothetical protein
VTSTETSERAKLVTSKSGGMSTEAIRKVPQNHKWREAERTPGFIIRALLLALIHLGLAGWQSSRSNKIMIPSSSPSGAKPFAFQIAYAEEDAARRDVERVVSFLSAHRRNIGTTTGRLKSRN